MPLHDSQANDDRDPVETVREDRAERSGVVPTLGWERVSARLDIHKIIVDDVPKMALNICQPPLVPTAPGSGFPYSRCQLR